MYFPSESFRNVCLGTDVVSKGIALYTVYIYMYDEVKFMLINFY